MKKLGLAALGCCVMFSCTTQNDAVCTHREVTSVTIHYIEDASSLDTFSDPDLKAAFATSNSSTWSYVTPTVSNVSSYPITISFTNSIPVTDELWDIAIIEDDSPDADDLVCSDSFNPTTTGQDGTIRFEKNGVLIFELNYTEVEDEG